MASCRRNEAGARQKRTAEIPLGIHFDLQETLVSLKSSCAYDNTRLCPHLRKNTGVKYICIYLPWTVTSQDTKGGLGQCIPAYLTMAPPALRPRLRPLLYLMNSS
jgi:hypothetical protein